MLCILFYVSQSARTNSVTRGFHFVQDGDTIIDIYFFEALAKLSRSFK